MSKRQPLLKKLLLSSVSTLSSLYDQLYSETTGNTRQIVSKSGISIPSYPVYKLDLAERVDTTLTRALYRNKDNRYSLAGQLAKPIIDNLVSFIGKPEFMYTSEAQKKVFDKFVVPYKNIHRMSTRDGDDAIWVQWQNDHIEFVVIPPEVIKEVWIDPVLKTITGYKLKESTSYSKKEETSARSTTEIEVTATYFKRTSQIDGNQEEATVVNPFGVIPIVMLPNDLETFEIRGHSEYENIEPMLKFYHDMTYEAGVSQKRDGHPKSKVKTGSIGNWVDNNFGAGTWAQVKEGNASISLQDRDLFVLEGDEDIQYIESNKATGDYTKLSETAFTNIVEGSGTPEIIFGANLGTNLAAAIEQRPIWRKRVTDKQEQFSPMWQKVFELAFMVYNYATFSNIGSKFTLEWPDPDFASTKEKADSLNIYANALVKLKENYLVGDEEAHTTLKKLNLLNLEHDFEKHELDIEKTVAKTAKRRLIAPPQGKTQASAGVGGEEDTGEGDNADAEDGGKEDAKVDGGKTNG